MRATKGLAEGNNSDQAMSEKQKISLDFALQLLSQLDDDIAKESESILRKQDPQTVCVWASEGSQPVASLISIYRVRDQKDAASVSGIRRLVEKLEILPSADKLRVIITEARDFYVLCFVDILLNTPYAALLVKGDRSWQ